MPFHQEVHRDAARIGSIHIGGHKQTTRCDPIIEDTHQALAYRVRQVIEQSSAIDEIELSSGIPLDGLASLFKDLVYGALSEFDCGFAGRLAQAFLDRRLRVEQRLFIEVKQGKMCALNRR